MKIQTHRFFSFVIVRPNGRPIINLRFSKNLIIFLVSFFVVATVAIGVTLYISLNSGFKLQAYQSLKEKYDSQSEQIRQYNLQLQDLSDEVDLLKDKELEIRSILGEKVKKKKGKALKSASKSTLARRQFRVAPDYSLEEITAKLETLEKDSKDMTESFSVLSQKIHQYKDRFAFTPSIWPVFGRIRSKFGMRRHPITKRRAMHKGIDIPSWQGAPIRATADGVVIYSGWSKTYGYLTIIDHKYGYKTIYAHASKLLTEKGEFVKKGQIIAQIGSTGLSTGSHLHYEIRRWRKAIRPDAYLDLDMFTASRRMW